MLLSQRNIDYVSDTNILYPPLGRRYCHARLVEPSSRSINSGDAYLLITTDKVFAWIGEYCNIIEKTKVKLDIE